MEEQLEVRADEDVQYQSSNIAEEEMGQLHAIHNNMNAVANVRRKLEKEALEPSLTHCEECGDEIPKARQLAIPGVKMCVFCKELSERR